MAFRWRAVRIQDGDVADPWDWIGSNKALVEEFNGRLDRDNFPQDDIGSDLIKGQAFNEVHQSSSDTQLTLPGSTSGWQAVDGSGTAINKIDTRLDYPALAIVRWSGSWGFSQSTPAYDKGTNTDLQWIEWRVTLNGYEVCHHPRSSFVRSEWSGGIVGAIEVPAGNVTVQVEYLTDTKGNRTTTEDIKVNGRGLLVRFRKV